MADWEPWWPYEEGRQYPYRSHNSRLDVNENEDWYDRSAYYGSLRPGYGAADQAQLNANTPRQPRGPYAGRGPRGYQRSDERIREEVNDRLTQHGYIDASDIEVGVQDGEVTLTGTVDSRRTKRMAEDVVESIGGVRDVHNRLTIRRVGQPAGQEQAEKAARGQR